MRRLSHGLVAAVLTASLVTGVTVTTVTAPAAAAQTKALKVAESSNSNSSLSTSSTPNTDKLGFDPITALGISAAFVVAANLLLNVVYARDYHTLFSGKI